MCRECSRVIQTQRYCDASLETSKDPYFNPSALLIEIPGKEDAGLNNMKYVFSRGHCFVDILPGFACVIFSELIPARPIRQHRYVA